MKTRQLFALLAGAGLAASICLAQPPPSAGTPVIFGGSSGGGGGGSVSGVSNSDGTLTISPTTGAVVASLALGHANTWTAAQTFPASGVILTGSSTGVTTFASANAGASNYTITFPAVTGTVALTSGVVSSIAGTAGQITASASTGSVTLSLPSALTGINSVTSTAGQPLVLATGTSGTAISAASATNLLTFSAYTTAGILTNNASGVVASLSNASSASSVLLGILGSGTASSSTYLRGDGTWATPAGGSSSGSSTWVQYSTGSGGFGANSGFTSDTSGNVVGLSFQSATFKPVSANSGSVGTAALRFANGYFGASGITIANGTSGGATITTTGASGSEVLTLAGGSTGGVLIQIPSNSSSTSYQIMTYGGSPFLTVRNDIGGYYGASIFLGYNSGNTGSSGGFNIGIGYAALSSVTSGAYNISIGGNSLITSGSYNVSISGTGTIGTGSNNVLVGYSTGSAFTTGVSNNTLIGYWAGRNITTGNNNLLLGNNTGYSGTGNALTTGSSCIIIGDSITVPSATASYQLNIGNLIYSATLGYNTTAGSRLMIGTTTDDGSHVLQVAGSVSSSSSYTSGAPNGGTAAAWKFGTVVTAASVASTTQYLQVDVGGVMYKVVIN